MTTDEQQPEPEVQAVAVAAERGLCELFNGGGGVHEDMLLRHCLRFLHLWEISRIGPTVSKAWLRCVEDRCYAQLAAPGRELELRADPGCEAQPMVADENHRRGGAEEEEQTVVARVIEPVDEEDRAALLASQGLRVVVYPASGPGRSDSNSNGIALSGRHAALVRDPRSSSVIVKRQDVRRFTSPVCSPVVEAWVREELTEGTKPLAMEAAGTLSVFLPFSCRRCGARPQEGQPKHPGEGELSEGPSGGLSGAAAAGEEEEAPQRSRSRGASRFCALQLRPGVRENLAWVTLQDRARRLECADCAVLAAVEQQAAGGSGSGRVGGAAEGEEDRPSPWLHIDFHTGAPGGAASAAANGRAVTAGAATAGAATAGATAATAEQKEGGQGSVASRSSGPTGSSSRDAVSEWVEARYMGSDEFTTLPRGGGDLYMQTNDLQVPGNSLRYV